MFWYLATAVVGLIGLGALVVAIVDDTSRPGSSATAAVAAGLWILLSAFFMFHTVDAGHVGLVKTWGAYTGVKEPGAVITWPWQELEEVRTRNASHEILMDGREGRGSAASRDSQAVYVDATLNYSLDKSCVEDLYTRYGGDYYRTVVEPRVKQIFKAETVQYAATDVLPEREKIREETQRALDGQLHQFCLRGIDFLLTDVGFDDAFEKAISEKVVAAQRVLTKENEIQVAQREATRKLIEARGEANAARARRASLTPLLVEWERIHQWKPQVIYLPSNAIVGTAGAGR